MKVLVIRFENYAFFGHRYFHLFFYYSILIEYVSMIFFLSSTILIIFFANLNIDLSYIFLYI